MKNKNRILEYILVYITIFEIGDVKFYLNDDLFLILMFIFSVAIILFLLSKGKQENIVIRYAFFLIISIIINGIFNYFYFNSISTYVGHIIRVIIALSITNIMSFKNFSDKFIKLMLFICFTSLIFFIIGYLDNNFRYLFPVIQKELGSRFGNAVLYSYNLDPNILSVSRNSSIFNEPGKFQICISIALFFELSYNQLKNKTRVILFIITMLTTGSSAGYICLVIILIIKLFEGKMIKSVYKGMIILALISVTFSSKFQTNILNKLSENNTSFNRRSIDYNIDIEIIKRNPVIGVGISKYSLLFNNMLANQTSNYYGSMIQSSSNSLTSSFAIYGLLLPTMILWGIFRFLKKNYYGSGAAFILAYCIFLIICASQNVMISILIFVICMYGFKTDNFNDLSKKGRIK
ncbi:O-antigen ligase family protein [Clostridium sp. YIM B02506]|uniref:O-antigen ligase family protein n=1 Tax=Clostridium sp. YIM B02506 TaxID=2910680 RepID=UPI001EED57DF|nr:O-antigen ligase family protein [Clostridium sp. YIM B02506]